MIPQILVKRPVSAGILFTNVPRATLLRQRHFWFFDEKNEFIKVREKYTLFCTDGILRITHVSGEVRILLRFKDGPWAVASITEELKGQYAEWLEKVEGWKPPLTIHLSNALHLSVGGQSAAHATLYLTNAPSLHLQHKALHFVDASGNLWLQRSTYILSADGTLWQMRHPGIGLEQVKGGQRFRFPNPGAKRKRKKR